MTFAGTGAFSPGILGRRVLGGKAMFLCICNREEGTGWETEGTPSGDERKSIIMLNTR